MHYVIGDVHGCYDEMIALINKIEQNDLDARFIFVGDFIDRGPQVDKVLEWCLNNITNDGKYTSVRGNHEALVIEWYQRWVNWWECSSMADRESYSRMPLLTYDFFDWMIKMDKASPLQIKEYIDFFIDLPYNKTLEVRSKWGRKVTYRICHAYYEFDDIPEIEQHYSNLFTRVYTSNNFSDDIIVHGHTPTFNPRYILSDMENTFPGLVSYRLNDINVDGGCAFAGKYDYPCMLCAICLETLDEIYPYEFERDNKESFYRNEMLRKLGKG